MEQTGGLVCAYQLLDYSAQRTLAHNLSYTSAEEVLVEILSIPDVEKLRALEIIKVRVSPLYDQLAFTLLAKRVPIQVYESSLFGIKRDDLKILEEAGISYQVVD